MGPKGVIVPLALAEDLAWGLPKESAGSFLTALFCP